MNWKKNLSLLLFCVFFQHFGGSYVCKPAIFVCTKTSLNLAFARQARDSSTATLGAAPWRPGNLRIFGSLFGFHRGPKEAVMETVCFGGWWWKPYLCWYEFLWIQKNHTSNLTSTFIEKKNDRKCTYTHNCVICPECKLEAAVNCQSSQIWT